MKMLVAAFDRIVDTHYLVVPIHDRDGRITGMEAATGWRHIKELLADAGRALVNVRHA